MGMYGMGYSDDHEQKVRNSAYYHKKATEYGEIIEFGTLQGTIKEVKEE